MIGSAYFTSPASPTPASHFMTVRTDENILNDISLICIVFQVLLSSEIFQTGVNSSEVGLAITSAMALAGMFQWGVRLSAEAENQMTSVERIIEYGKLPSEAPLECINKGKKKVSCA